CPRLARARRPAAAERTPARARAAAPATLPAMSSSTRRRSTGRDLPQPNTAASGSAVNRPDQRVDISVPQFQVRRPRFARRRHLVLIVEAERRLAPDDAVVALEELQADGASHPLPDLRDERLNRPARGAVPA